MEIIRDVDDDSLPIEKALFALYSALEDLEANRHSFHRPAGLIARDALDRADYLLSPRA